MLRFWRKVDKTAADGCWNWTARTVGGYGQFSVGAKKKVYAHRYAYELLVGPIPKGLTIDHLCRNKSCVNPEHLEPVTIAENIRRARKTHCPQGHEYSSVNTYVYPSGARRCRTCHRKETSTAQKRKRAEARERRLAVR